MPQNKTYPIYVTHTGPHKLSEYQNSLNFLYGINCALLRAMPRKKLKELVERFFNSVRYEEEPYDEWVNIFILLERGVGDCEDIACAVAAILTVYYLVPTSPYCFQVSEVTYHVITKIWGLTGYRLFDPCRLMGMRV